MKKDNRKKTNSVNKAEIRKDNLGNLDFKNIQQNEIPPNDKKQNVFKNIIITVITIFLILIIIKIIDDYTGWGDIEKVIKKNIDMADKNAIYKRYDSAIKIYENILKKWKDNPKYADLIKQVRLNLAKTYKEANENIQAIQLFKELLEEYKTSNRDMYAWILLEIGETYNNMYNTQDAIKTYQIIIDEFANSDWEAEAIFGIAESYKIAGKNDVALKYYQQIVNKYKNGFLSAEALTNIAQIYERQGKEKEAIKIYKKIMNEFPEIVTEYAKLRYNTLNEKLKNK